MVMREKATGKIDIFDVDSDTVLDMLTFIYSGKLKDLEHKAERLLPAAEKYLIKRLKKKCEECLCKSLTVDNCLEYLVDADRYNAGHLKPLVIKFVVDNCRELSRRRGGERSLSNFPLFLLRFL